MAIQRVISEEQRSKIKESKKFKSKKFSSLSNNEKDELLEIVAKKLNLI